MAKFFPMFSGSDGNSTYIGSADGGVLVDVGVSYKRIKNSLAGAGISLAGIKAVLITHHHNDHIKGLRVFLKNNPVPVVASRETVYALEYQGIIDDKYPRIYMKPILQNWAKLRFAQPPQVTTAKAQVVLQFLLPMG